MSRSKSRSGSFDFGRKNRSSVFSKTLSASKFCRGDLLISQIDQNALKPVEQNPSKSANSSEKQVDRVSRMQQHAALLDEELKTTKDQLGIAKDERDRALGEAQEMKMAAREAKMKLSEESLPSRNAAEAYAELNVVKESLSYSTRELQKKENNIDSLKLELERAKEFEVRLAERDASIGKMKEELSNVKASEAQAMELLSESKRKIQELGGVIERGKLSDDKMRENLVSVTEQLEQTKIELRESKLEVASLREKIEKLRVFPSPICDHENVDLMETRIEVLNSELQLVKENLARAQESEKIASSKAKDLLEEINSLKSELKLAIGAEEKSKKAMDDLALALKEVATEANQAKEKLALTETELEHVKQESGQLKGMVRGTEDGYQKVLDELKKENERYKNTVERLRLEAEESLLAWNDKEIGFVSCIRRAEGERDRLIESLKAAENMTRTSKEENLKLRDILKQALNEANVAKEASGIAKEENSQLQDLLAEKNEAIEFLIRENENLRTNEAAAHESIKELKRLLSAATSELNADGKELENGKKLNKAFSFNLSELKIPSEHGDVNGKVNDKDLVNAEALKGSIFDTVDSPLSEPRTPIHRRVVSSFADGREVITSEDLEHLEGSDDAEKDRSLQRKRRALLWKFGELIKRKG